MPRRFQPTSAACCPTLARADVGRGASAGIVFDCDYVMRNSLVIISCILSILSRGAAAGAQSGVTAFTRFNVVPMTRDTVLRDHTVVVADGKIIAVGPSRSIRVPSGAARVDGGGTQFILPALADMHTH